MARLLDLLGRPYGALLHGPAGVLFAECRAGVALLPLDRHGPAIQQQLKMVVRRTRYIRAATTEHVHRHLLTSALDHIIPSSWLLSPSKGNATAVAKCMNALSNSALPAAASVWQLGWALGGRPWRGLAGAASRWCPALSPWPGVMAAPSSASSSASSSRWNQHRPVPKAPLAACTEWLLHLVHCKQTQGTLQAPANMRSSFKQPARLRLQTCHWCAAHHRQSSRKDSVFTCSHEKH